MHRENAKTSLNVSMREGLKFTISKEAALASKTKSAVVTNILEAHFNSFGYKTIAVIAMELGYNQMVAENYDTAVMKRLSPEYPFTTVTTCITGREETHILYNPTYALVKEVGRILEEIT